LEKVAKITLKTANSRLSDQLQNGCRQGVTNGRPLGLSILEMKNSQPPKPNNQFKRAPSPRDIWIKK
jgi:hypothetical protein